MQLCLGDNVDYILDKLNRIMIIQLFQMGMGLNSTNYIYIVVIGVMVKNMGMANNLYIHITQCLNWGVMD